MQGGDVTFTRDHAEQACAWFAALGRKLALDFDHQSILREDSLRPAAGWIGRLEIRADGLWAAGVEWTAQARALLASAEYRYFSPVVYWSGAENDQVQSLGPVAITNNPAMRGVPALAASRRTERIGGKMQHVSICAARPLSPSGQANEAMGQDETDTEIDPELLLTAEELALAKGFFDYAFELAGPLDILLDQSKAMGRERFLATAAKLRDIAAPGNVDKVAEILDLLGEIAEHREKLMAVEEPEPGTTPGGATVSRAAGDDDALNRAVYRASPALQREFTCAESYTAYQRARAAGRVNVVSKSSSAVYSAPKAGRHTTGINDVGDEAFATICRRAFNDSAALQAEFGSAETYIAFRRAERRGLVKICGKSRGVVHG